MDFDVVVIGGGVVGLAVAREAAERGKEVLLLERHETAGRETSSRNSEVIHGGMYYAANSLKARLCVQGRRMTYDFADKHHVHYKKGGKLIIAVNPEEQEELDRILFRGQINGVENLRYATMEEIRAREPNVRATAGLLSQETGIIDAHGFMHALAKDAENHGATLLFASPVHGLRQEKNDGWTVLFTDVEEENAVSTRIVVNAAGLSAQRIMSFAGVAADACDLTLCPCKGAYFSLSGTAGKNIRGLVYPAPEKNLAGLGIHTLIDLAGRVRLGPNVQYVDAADEYDYRVDPEWLEQFYERASRYLPFLRKDDLAPDFSGVRPKLSGPGQPARDFYIAEESARGKPGFINLAGIESPGLTSAMAIGMMAMDLGKNHI